MLSRASHSQGRAARSGSGSGRAESPHGVRRRRTSSGLTARRSVRMRMMLSANRRLAASDEVRVLSRARDLHRTTSEAILAHRHMSRLCAKIASGLVRSCRGRAAERTRVKQGCGENLHIHGRPLPRLSLGFRFGRTPLKDHASPRSLDTA